MQTEDIFVQRVAVTPAHLQHLAILRYINIFNNNNNNPVQSNPIWMFTTYIQFNP